MVKCFRIDVSLTSYYFNHHMALTLLNLRVHLISRATTMHIDEQQVEFAIQKGKLRGKASMCCSIHELIFF